MDGEGRVVSFKNERKVQPTREAMTSLRKTAKKREP